MRNMIKKGALLTVVALSGVARGFEFRSPYSIERGPLRYIVFQNEKEDRYSLSLWSEGYWREAHRAFTKHSTKTRELTSVFFGKDDFRLREIFPNSDVPGTSEFFNPFMKVLRFKPRASYTEHGLIVGGRFEYPVWEDKGRIGLRVAVPFKVIEIERNDQGDADDAQLHDVFVTSNNNTGNPDGEAPNDDTPMLGNRKAIRLDFLEALLESALIRSPLLVYGDGSDNASNAGIVIGGTRAVLKTGIPLSDAGNPLMSARSVNNTTNSEGARVVLQFSCEGIVPGSPGALRDADANNPAGGTSIDPITGLITAAQIKNGELNDPTKKVAISNGDFTGFDEANITNICDKLKLACLKATLWVGETPSAVDGKLIDSTENIFSGIELAIQNNNENVFEWLSDRGWLMQTERRSGIGDLDLDFFYEHKFCCDLIGELMLGIRFPTAAERHYNGNPYRPWTGNGGHFEIKIGGLLGYQPLDWMNIKFDTYYSFVLKAREELAASFKGAQIKNFGPRADADVDWGYWVARLDFNFFHPKTKNLSSLIGYELYWKQKDHIRFKCCKVQSWLGRTVVFTEGEPGTITLVDNPVDLDHCLAERHTERIGHKVRGETSYRFSQYFELYGGGTYTFAGKNLPRESDWYCGCNVNF